MSDIDRKEPFDEKASTHEVDLVNDPDAGLTEEERKEAVSDYRYMSKSLILTTCRRRSCFERLMSSLFLGYDCRIRVNDPY